MYVLVLGLDVLGNPFGLIRGLSEGFEALFYEPYQVEYEHLSSFSSRSSSYLMLLSDCVTLTTLCFPGSHPGT